MAGGRAGVDLRPAIRVVLVPNIGLHAHANILVFIHLIQDVRYIEIATPFSVLQRAVQRFVYIAINAAFSDLAIQFWRVVF
jgi:hypothetical protein